MAKGRKTGGRKKGTANKATVEARAFCVSIVDDPQYQARFRHRALQGKVPPAIESLMWHYAKGKPKESVELSGDEELLKRLAYGRQLLQPQAGKPTS